MPITLEASCPTAHSGNETEVITVHKRSNLPRNFITAGRSDARDIRWSAMNFKKIDSIPLNMSVDKQFQF